MNHEKDLKIIESFIGKECERTLVCNSLKIRFGEKSPYIWLDPPWELWGAKGLISSSFEYTGSEEDFQNYSETLNPLNKTKLVDFEHTDRSGLVLTFQNGLRLHAPNSLEAVDKDDFYHHWYASGKNT